VVIVAGDSAKVTDQVQAAAIEDVVSSVRALPGVASVGDPFAAKAVSADRSTALVGVTYTAKAADITDHQREQLVAPADGAESAGLRVDLSGDATQAQTGPSGTEGLGLLVAAVVLVITFGSLLAAGLPLLTAVLGVALGVLGITIASGFTDVSATTPVLAL